MHSEEEFVNSNDKMIKDSLVEGQTVMGGSTPPKVKEAEGKD
jgi:hypothetical protein